MQQSKKWPKKLLGLLAGTEWKPLYIRAEELKNVKLGSFGENEEEIVYIVPLNKNYWRDGLENAEFEFPLDIDNSNNWCDADIADFAEYLIETELSNATDRHNGEMIEWKAE